MSLATSRYGWAGHIVKPPWVVLPSASRS